MIKLTKDKLDFLCSKSDSFREGLKDSLVMKEEITSKTGKKYDIYTIIPSGNLVDYVPEETKTDFMLVNDSEAKAIMALSGRDLGFVPTKIEDDFGRTKSVVAIADLLMGEIISTPAEAKASGKAKKMKAEGQAELPSVEIPDFTE